MDQKAIDIARTICGSCKRGEVAIGHCTNCACFICQNCYTAHRIMYYFQNHQVTNFEAIKRNEECVRVSQNLANCKCHPNEVLNYYCHTCRIPVCSECMVLDHKLPEHCCAKTLYPETEERHKLKELFDSLPYSLPQIDIQNNIVVQRNLIQLANLKDSVSNISCSSLPVPISQNKLLINNTQIDVTRAQFNEINYSTTLFNKESSSLGNSLSATENHSNNPKPRSSGRQPKTMRIRYIFGQGDSGKEFNFPNGFCLGQKEEIIVADTDNHKIKIFERHGNVMYQFGRRGISEGELWFPRKVAVIQSTDSFVVCDKGSRVSRMQVFTKAGDFLQEINVRYVSIICGLVTTEDTIIIVDNKSRVFVISYNGDLLYSFDCSDYIKEPSDIAVYQNEFYICDFKGHCVAVFKDKGNFLRSFGSKCLTKYPTGIHITSEGDVLVADSHRNSYHISIFSQKGSLIEEFECPCIKVKLCCGLKVTSEGFVITVANSDHQVLVFDPLCIFPNTNIKSSSVDVNRILT